MKHIEKHAVTLEFKTREDLEEVTKKIIRENPSVRLAGIIDYNLTEWEKNE